jgi:monoamine oxidase
MRIGIVGLGFAGLRAAQLLEQEGIEVATFEARLRLGGRVHTIERGDVRYEAGGEWIDADHRRVLSLIEEFGMEPVRAQPWPNRLVYDQEQVTEDLVWSEALEDELRFEGAARELCRNLQSPAWMNVHVADLDDVTLADFVDASAHSCKGRWWLHAKLRSDEGDDLDRIGLLGWLSGYLQYLDRDGDVMSAFRIPGGGEPFCAMMASRLRHEPRLGWVLRRVGQESGKVRLDFDQGSEWFDRIILTLPPPALEQVVFEPALTVEKRCAVEACRMGRAVKIVWQFREAWWREEGWGGRMLCNGPLQQTWEGGQGDAPILTAYICGKDAVGWRDLGDPVRAGLYELSKMFPQAAGSFVDGWWHDWVGDPYAMGAFSHLAPGYVLQHMEHISPPHGRIHFAGEHTSSWVGFIEGALESAERVAWEVVRAEGRG